MRPLWFGGSFNPIHFGHLICARAVAETAGFDRVILVPNRQPPHKSGDMSLAGAEDRLEMCRLAIDDESLFEVDDLELNRPGPSYTIDTARQLRSRGWSEISWLVGADMAISLPGWHQSDQLLAEVNFILMARPGSLIDWNILPGQMQRFRSNVVATPQLDISSTALRDRLSRGKSIRYLTPDAVVDYIQRKKLYAG
jgi:nicotinate-nucleotide adenylyltransferase